MSGNQVVPNKAKYGQLLNKLHKWRDAVETNPKVGNGPVTKKPLSQSQVDQRQLHPNTGDGKKRTFVQETFKMVKKIKLPDKPSNSLPVATVKPTQRKPENAMVKAKSEAAKAKEAAKAAELKQKLAEWRKKKEEEKEKSKQTRRAAFVPSSSKINLLPADNIPRMQKSLTLGKLPPQSAKNPPLKRRETFCAGKSVNRVPISRHESAAPINIRDNGATRPPVTNKPRAPVERGFISQASSINQRRVSMPVSRGRTSNVAPSKPRPSTSKTVTQGTSSKRFSPRLAIKNPKSATALSRSTKIPPTRQSTGIIQRVPVSQPPHKQVKAVTASSQRAIGPDVGRRMSTNVQKTPGRVTPHKPKLGYIPSAAAKRNPVTPVDKNKNAPRRITKPNNSQVRPPLSAASRNNARRSVSTGNLPQKGKASSEKKNIQKSASATDIKTTPKKIAPRKSILKTPHRETIPEETSADMTPPMDGKGTGVRFFIPISRGGTPSGTPGTGSKRKSVSLTPLMARREALNKWLIAKGKTPTRFTHLCCFDEQLSAHKKKIVPVTGLDVHELAQQQTKLHHEDSICLEPAVEPPQESPKESTSGGRADIPAIRPPLSDVTDHTYHGVAMSEEMQQELISLLDECSGLMFDAGCPAPSVLGWLDDIGAHFDGATSTAAYWICRANVVEEMDDDHMTVDVYEQACRHNAQPAEDVAEALKQFVVRMDERSRAKKMASRTPHKRRSGVEESNVFQSSSIKYCITHTTPFFKKLHRIADLDEPVQAVITPVRRSTRRSTTNLPTMLQDHDVIVDHIEDIPAEERTTTLFLPNVAIDVVESEDSDYDEDLENKENQPPIIRNLSHEFEEASEDENNEPSFPVSFHSVGISSH